MDDGAFALWADDLTSPEVTSDIIFDDLASSLTREDWAWLDVIRAGTTLCPDHQVVHGTLPETVLLANATYPSVGR